MITLGKTFERLGLVVAVVGALTITARADEPVGGVDNLCLNEDIHRRCTTSSDCAGNDRAVICVEHVQGQPASRRCENPCENGVGVGVTGNPGQCGIGETCIEGRATPNRKAFWCKPSKFRVDLNLLDQCVAYHLGGLQPTFTDNSCSLDANLTALLDQNGDRVFDIFDLDLCILAFLEQPGCDLATRTCDAPDLIPCANDDECGSGLYCDGQRNTCQRDCGIVASREFGQSELERHCLGNGKVCDNDRGRCVSVDVTASTCEVDAQCPSGAYCFLGRCAPNCYRSVDCPSNNWYCTQNNRCRALPPPEAEGAFVFDPQNYAIRFARDEMRLDGVQTSDLSALVILDLLSKRQVVGNPSIAFGFRLEMSYGLKKDVQCLKPFVDCADSRQRPAGETESTCRVRQDDCFIDDSEQWVTLEQPFGIASAAGTPAIGLRLDETAAERLSPGVYGATLRAIFDNGDSHSIAVTYTRTSPSGEYDGRLSVYRNNPENALNPGGPATFGMRIKLYDGVYKRWNDLLAEYNLVPADAATDENGFVDITRGILVHGQIHGQSALMFTRGGATSSADNEVPFVGLYSPELGRMRLIGLIDIARDFCASSAGNCFVSSNDPNYLRVENPFSRPIRRVMEFIGPFDDAIGRFSGIYREKIHNLVDHTVTLEGGFILDQIIGDDSPMAVSPGDFSPDRPYSLFAAAISANETEISRNCTSLPNMAPGNPPPGTTELAVVQNHFANASNFESYIRAARRYGSATVRSALGRQTIFPALRQFKDTITEALAGLGSQTPQQQQNNLSIYDFLEPWVLPCETASASPPPVCISEPSVRCGLALHRRAVLNGWLGVSDAIWPGDGAIFCPDTIPLQGCFASGSTAPQLFAFQEHNRFWLDLVQILKFRADRARSNAFLTLFRNEGNPFTASAAINYKIDRLKESLKDYDGIIREIAGLVASGVFLTNDLGRFPDQGREILNLVYTILADRLDAIQELVDVQRRVTPAGQNLDFVYADHLMQYEYLIRVFFAELQARWEGPAFQYLGESTDFFTRGQAIMNQLNPARNAVGVVAGQVYFESGRTNRYNWQSYREQVGAFANEVAALVDAGATNMKAALSDLDAFERSLHESRQALNVRLDDLCGDPGRTTSSCDTLRAAYDTNNEFRRAMECKFIKYLQRHNEEVNKTPDTERTETLTVLGTPQQITFTDRGERDPLIAAYIGDSAYEFLPGLECPPDDAFAADAELTCLDRDLSEQFKQTIAELAFLGSNAQGDDINSTGGNNCMKIVMSLAGSVGSIGSDSTGNDLIHTPPNCYLSSDRPKVNVNGVQRACIGGQMGGLLQEKARIDRERRMVLGSVETELNGIRRALTAHFETELEDYGIYWRQRAINVGTKGIDLIRGLLDEADETAEKTLDAVKCMLIVGLASGTDCPQKAAATTGQKVKDVLKWLAKFALDRAKDVLESVQAETDRRGGIDKDRIATWSGLTDNIDSLIDQYSGFTQTSYNLQERIDDLLYQAQAAVRGYNSDISFVAEHLVGRETGNFILGQAQARGAEARFRDLVQYLYRMTMAFIHHFNLSPGDATPLAARVLTLTTLGDVGSYLAYLDNLAATYCGRGGIDCDYENNTETLRISLRDVLFPNLRDVVDPHSGRVLTAGQQFHNLITRPPFLRRRIRGVMPTDQIEIPFAVTGMPLENTPDGEPRWLVDPLTCNQHLDGRDPTVAGSIPGDGSRSGTLAVNLVGQNLDDASRVVRYQVARGAVDFIRACEPENTFPRPGALPVVSYPLRRHIIGYSPENALSRTDSPPSYVSVSQPFTACVNQGENTGSLVEAGCWRYFARDRSLASPDYKLIIPITVDGVNTESSWVAQTGLAAAQTPVVEDIIVYFRYRSRPIQE